MTARPWRRAAAADFQKLDLRAHALLADVPLHDVWQLDLEGGPREPTVDLLRGTLSFEALSQLGWVVRSLFGLRAWLGRVFGWDAKEERPAPGSESYLQRLTPEDRAAATVELGSFDGPFRVIYGDAREGIGEIRNATVHAFSVYALTKTPEGARLFWAVYVEPVGRITALYMALIDPFRRLFVYPAILRHVHRSWLRDFAG